jgi:glycosyltransferase involved in cell wall biosynthesis
MRVAAVVPHAAAGGPSAERRLISGALALGAAGVSVDIFSDRAVAGSLRWLGEGVAVRRLAPHRLQRDLAATDGAYDVVHAFGLPAMRMIASRGAARYRVFSPYGDRWSEPAPVHAVHRAWPRAASILIGAVDTIVCGSDKEATGVRRDAPELGDRVRVVLPGVDAEALRRAEPISIGRAVVVALGPLVRSPRPVRVVGALASLDERFVLVVLGDGPARRRLRGVVGDLGLKDRVHFLGDVTLEERRRWMNTASVLLPMSEYEDVEMLALEAAAIGKPLIIPDSAEQAGGWDYESGGTVRVISGPPSPLAIADAIRETAVFHGSMPGAQVRSWAAHAQEMLSVYRLTTHRVREIEPPPAVERPDESRRLQSAGFEREGRVS